MRQLYNLVLLRIHLQCVLQASCSLRGECGGEVALEGVPSLGFGEGQRRNIPAVFSELFVSRGYIWS